MQKTRVERITPVLRGNVSLIFLHTIMCDDFILKWTEVKWSEVKWSYGEVLGDKSTMYFKVTLYWGHLIILWLFPLGISRSLFVVTCTMVVTHFVMFVCLCVRVHVCVCVGFVMRWCFGNMHTCIYVVFYCLYLVFGIVSFMYIYSYLFVLL